MNSAHPINVRSAAGGGLSVIDLVQLLRSELHLAQGITISDSKKEMKNVNQVWERFKKQGEFKEVSSVRIQGYQTPVLVSQRQLQALISMRPYSLIIHSFRGGHVPEIDLSPLLHHGQVHPWPARASSIDVLPPMGASPDGILVLTAGGEEEQDLERGIKWSHPRDRSPRSGLS